MGFRCGIVGLPNVGKSTLFNALTETAAAQAANYPFCTIEPNVGRVAVPDPRLPLMMSAPPRQKDASEELQPFVSVKPRSGLLLMWESWLRHEVLPGTGRSERLSISFNFA